MARPAAREHAREPMASRNKTWSFVLNAAAAAIVSLIVTSLITWAIGQSEWFTADVGRRAVHAIVAQGLHEIEFSVQDPHESVEANKEINVACSDGYVLITPLCEFSEGMQKTYGYTAGRIEQHGDKTVGVCRANVQMGGSPRIAGSALCARARQQ